MLKDIPENIFPETNWINNFKSLVPGLTHNTFFSKSMKREIGYGIYIPQNYNFNSKSAAAAAKDRFPVIYWLHGKGGDESTGFKLSIPAMFHNAIKEGKVNPAIMVFPNCGNFSMFCDSYDNSIMGETIFIKELIPLIDATFKTIGSGKSRALEGFSMGGFGAIKLAFKFPELFSTVVSHAGSFHDLESVSANRPDVFKAVFSDNAKYFQQNSPYVLAEKNLELIKSNLKLKFLNGSLDFTLKNNYKLNTKLDSLGIKYEFKVLEGFKHIPWPYYKAEGLNGFIFHSDNLEF
jgi:enterochelin esterase-like enzyme